MSTRRLVLALGLTLLALPLGPAAPAPAREAAQASASQWMTYASGDEVLALAVGPDGRLWAGSEGGGVVVWDADFGDFEQHLFPGPEGLPANDVRAVALAPDGSAWLATPVGVTHAEGARWRTYGTADGLPGTDVTAIAVTDTGDVWAGTYDAGVAVLEEGQEVWTAYPAVEFVPGDEDLQDGPGEAEASAILAGDDGRVWVAHGRAGAAGQPALSVYDPADRAWRFVSAVQPGGDASVGPVTNQVLALASTDEGLWLGTWSRGVLRYDEAQGLWEQYDVADGLCGSNVWAMTADGDALWVTCEEGGAAYWRDGVWTDYELVGHPFGFDLGTDVARAVAALDGTAWLGLNGPGNNGSGILTIDAAQLLEPLRTAPVTPWSNDITAIAFEPVGGVAWIGTSGAGLMRYDGSTWDRYTREGTDGDLPGDTVTDLVWRDGEMWVACTKTLFEDAQWVDGGVAAIDTDTLRWTLRLRSDDSQLPDDDVSSLALAPDGRLWIGMGAGLGGPGSGNTVQNGDGVAVYDPDADRFEAFYDYHEAGDELAGRTVLDLAAAGDDVWAAISYSTVDDRKRGGGVSRFAGDGWQSWSGGEDGLATFHGSGDPNDVDPFITGDVRSIVVDRTGRPWAGTWDLDVPGLSSIWPYVDAVVNHLDGTQWTAEVFAGQGWVSSLVEDSAGRIWAGTTRGHDRQEIDLKTGRRSDTARGGVQLWNGSSWTDLVPSNSGLASNAVTALALDPSTGHVWVGTENGGLSVYQVGEPVATSTPCIDCPTHTPRPAASSTVPIILTVPGGSPGPDGDPRTPTRTGQAGLPTMTALPGPQPPPEVPEASTVLLLGAGLAAVGAWLGWRKRTAAGPEDAPGP